MDRAWLIFDNTHGSPPWIGKHWKRRNHSLPSFRMYVISFSIGTKLDVILHADEESQFRCNPWTRRILDGRETFDALKAQSQPGPREYETGDPRNGRTVCHDLYALSYLADLRYFFNRFTVYDFSSSKRMSYYPHNLPIVSTGHDFESDEPAPLQSQTNTLIPSATTGERSLAGSPQPDISHHNMPSIPLPRRANR